MSRRALLFSLGREKPSPSEPEGSAFLRTFYEGRSPEPLPIIAVRGGILEIDHHDAEPAAELRRAQDTSEDTT